MFTKDRQSILDALDVMIPCCCAYGGADRCDCKYGVKSGKWPTMAEAGNGCPELRSIRLLISAMTDDEWDLLTRRAGGVNVAALFGAGEGLAQAVIRASSSLTQAQGHLEEAYEALAASAPLNQEARPE